MDGMNPDAHTHHNTTPMPSSPPAMGHDMGMSHMTFFWGSRSEVLFSGWPGSSHGMYALCLIVVFILSVLVEWFPRCHMIKPGASNVSSGLVQTAMHAIRVGLAYIVMLAVMSFNVGVFLAALAGHTLGFLVFGSRVFRKEDKNHDLPLMSC